MWCSWPFLQLRGLFIQHQQEHSSPSPGGSGLVGETSAPCARSREEETDARGKHSLASWNGGVRKALSEVTFELRPVDEQGLSSGKYRSAARSSGTCDIAFPGLLSEMQNHEVGLKTC